MKTVLTENWIFDGAKYLFSMEELDFVGKPKLFSIFTRRSSCQTPPSPRASLMGVQGQWDGPGLWGHETHTLRSLCKGQRSRPSCWGLSHCDKSFQAQRGHDNTSQNDEQELAPWHRGERVRTLKQTPRRGVLPCVHLEVKLAMAKKPYSGLG